MDDDPHADEVPLDVVFDVLSSRRRRMVLAYLFVHDRESDISALAEQIAAWENDVPVDEIETDDRKRAYVGLYQLHLPKMAQQGILGFDDTSGAVSLTDRGASMLSQLADLDFRGIVARDGIEIPDTVTLE